MHRVATANAHLSVHIQNKENLWGTIWRTLGRTNLLSFHVLNIHCLQFVHSTYCIQKRVCYAERKRKTERERSLSLFNSLFIGGEGFGRMLLPEIQVVWYGYNIILFIENLIYYRGTGLLAVV